MLLIISSFAGYFGWWHFLWHTFSTNSLYDNTALADPGFPKTGGGESPVLAKILGHLECHIWHLHMLVMPCKLLWRKKKGGALPNHPPPLNPPLQWLNQTIRIQNVMFKHKPCVHKLSVTITSIRIKVNKTLAAWIVIVGHQ